MSGGFQNMTRGQKRSLILLLLVLAYGVFDFITNREDYLAFYAGEKTALDMALDSLKQEGETPVDSTTTEEAPVATVVYTGGWGKDPFALPARPSRARKAPPAQKRQFRLRLRGVSISQTRSVALINNAVVKEGEYIGPYRVVKIYPDRVVLTNGRERRVLTVE